LGANHRLFTGNIQKSFNFGLPTGATGAERLRAAAAREPK
jgi:hypothetical protein